MTDLTPYLNRLDILNDTAQQVIKDFGMIGVEITPIAIGVSGNTENAYAELFSQVLPQIEKIQKENFQNFYNLMYRIDISEGQIKKAALEAKDKSFAEIISDLILKRELLKVVTRKSFSVGKGL